MIWMMVHRTMRTQLILRLPLLLAPLLLVTCGTYALGKIRPQEGKTPDQQQLDILTCKDQAGTTANSAGRQTADFFLGLTIVGAPIAIQREKNKEREVFAECMRARGYVVTPAGQK